MKLFLFKFCTLIVLSSILLSMKTDNDRTALLSHTWVQFAFKKNGDTLSNPVARSYAKICTFNPNGSYEEYTNNSGVKISGYYFLNDNQSKIAFKFNVLNGQQLPGSPYDTAKRYNIIILRLTKDTLIYGQEARYGEKRVYGHDDWYFVRKK